MEQIRFEPGVLAELLAMVNLKVEGIPMMGRNVMLLWDEITLQPGMQYAQGLDRWVGEVTLPDHEGMADKGLAFMIVGITVHFKQVVAYHYATSRTDGNVYGPIVRDIVTQVEQTGLRVRGTSTDMGSPNQKFWT